LTKSCTFYTVQLYTTGGCRIRPLTEYTAARRKMKRDY